MKQTDILELATAEGAKGAETAMEPSAYQARAASSEIGLREPLSRLEWDWLSALLLSTGGVRNAMYVTRNGPRVVVKYDEASLDSLALVDFFYLCGVCPISTVPMKAR